MAYPVLLALGPTETREGPPLVRRFHLNPRPALPMQLLEEG